MRFNLLLGLCGLLAAAVGKVRGDADFMSVRTSLAKDYSGKGGDPAEKYFREFFFFLLIIMSQLIPREEQLLPNMPFR